MKQSHPNRRHFLAATLAGSAMAFSPRSITANQATVSQPARPLPGFNLSTIRSFNLSLFEELKIVHQAGFHRVELWIDRVRAELAKGTTPETIAKWLVDFDLRLENMIGFAAWIVNDETKRREGLRAMKDDMEVTARLGGRHIAACATGAWDVPVTVADAAPRFREVLRIGRETGVQPLLELWGASKSLSRLAELLAIVTEAEAAEPALLLDAYHLYRGGNSFDGLKLVAGSAMPVFHVNDYPGNIERTKLNDSDRIFPGDGICPLRQIVQTLIRNGFSGTLSLELFNRKYGETMSPIDIAKTGREKIEQLLTS